MRFRKGSKVEVLSKREVLSGSWSVAEIVSGNGRCYNVKYYGDDAMEKVQRKDIRPCPPAILGSRNWAPGDIVEVFENNSWKAARIVQVLDGVNYVVVILGRPSKEIEVSGSDIRLRQVWRGNRWILVDKESEQLFEGNMEITHDAEKWNNMKLQQCVEVKNRRKQKKSHAKNDKHADQHCQISLRGLKKRSHFCLQPLGGEGMAGAWRKKEAVKEEKRQRLLTTHSSELPEK